MGTRRPSAATVPDAPKRPKRHRKPTLPDQYVKSAQLSSARPVRASLRSHRPGATRLPPPTRPPTPPARHAPARSPHVPQPCARGRCARRAPTCGRPASGELRSARLRCRCDLIALLGRMGQHVLLQRAVPGPLRSPLPACCASLASPALHRARVSARQGPQLGGSLFPDLQLPAHVGGAVVVCDCWAGRPALVAPRRLPARLPRSCACCTSLDLSSGLTLVRDASAGCDNSHPAPPPPLDLSVENEQPCPRRRRTVAELRLCAQPCPEGWQWRGCSCLARMPCPALPITRQAAHQPPPPPRCGGGDSSAHPSLIPDPPGLHCRPQARRSGRAGLDTLLASAAQAVQPPPTAASRARPRAAPRERAAELPALPG